MKQHKCETDTHYLSTVKVAGTAVEQLDRLLASLEAVSLSEFKLQKEEQDILAMELAERPYETMLLEKDEDGKTDFSDPVITIRYATEEEAIAGHNQQIKNLKANNERVATAHEEELNKE